MSGDQEHTSGLVEHFFRHECGRRVEAALRLLDGIDSPTWLSTSYLWDAVVADLYRRAGRNELFDRHRDRAVSIAPSDAVRDLLRRRLSA